MKTVKPSIIDNISFVVNSKGKQTAMVIDLKDKQMRAWAEKIREDLLDWQLVEERLNEPKPEYVDFFEAADAILEK